MIGAFLSTALAASGPRYALVAGANDGGSDRVLLQFATRDARAVGAVLTELGGVPPEQLLVLPDPTRAELQAAIARLGVSLQGADDGSVIVYYSGHSDATGLLLQGETYAYGALRDDLEGIDAGVLVAIVDGCASGAMVRAKGSTPVPAFLPNVEVGVEGRAYLTSSSADELSQEADHLGGSYFTHALVSGLRGAADFDDDHRVTLREAYQFASEETLARTQRTRLGAQHPAYDIQLSGIGDYVLTDVASYGGRVQLDEALRGRTWLRDAEGRLVAELFKRSGRVVELGLAPGRYDALVDDGGDLLEGSVRVGDTGTATLARADLEPIEGEVAVARGRVYARVPVAVAFVPYPTSEGLDARDQLHHVSLGVLAVYAARLRGVGLGTVATTYRDGAQGVQLASAYNHAGELAGVQGTFGVNLAVHQARGVQLGTVNLAGSARGVQLGVLNYARDHRGLSLGMVHVSPVSRGAPIALLPLIGDGIHHLEAFASTASPLNLGAKLGSRTLYTQYQAGLDPWRGSATAGLGLGVRLRPEAWIVDLDALGTIGVRGGLSLLPALRVSVARPLRGESLAPFMTASVGLETPLDADAGSALWLESLPLSGSWRWVPGLGLGFRL